MSLLSVCCTRTVINFYCPPIFSVQLVLFTFYRAMLCIVWTMPSQDVSLSVRLTITCRYFVEMAIHIIKLFHHQVATPF